jgi:hypothetical protein
MKRTQSSSTSIVPKAKKMTVLVTHPDTEQIIREAMRVNKQTKEQAGNDLLRLAARIRRFPVMGEVKS